MPVSRGLSHWFRSEAAVLPRSLARVPQLKLLDSSPVSSDEPLRASEGMQSTGNIQEDDVALC